MQQTVEFDFVASASIYVRSPLSNSTKSNSTVKIDYVTGVDKTSTGTGVRGLTTGFASFLQANQEPLVVKTRLENHQVSLGSANS